MGPVTERATAAAPRVGRMSDAGRPIDPPPAPGVPGPGSPPFAPAGYAAPVVPGPVPAGPYGMTVGGAAPGSRRGRGAIVTGLVLVLLALVVLVGGVTLGWSRLRIPDDGPVLASVGTTDVTLEPGTWGLYRPDNTSLYATDIVVTGPDGPVTVDRLGGFFENGVTTTRGNVLYRAAASFVAPTRGTYRIELSDRSAGTVGGSSAVTPAPPSLDVLVAPYDKGDAGYTIILVAVAASFALGATGFVVLVIGLIRRAGRHRGAVAG